MLLPTLNAELRRALSVARFDDKAIQSVAKDQAVTLFALFFIVLASFAGSLGAYLFPIEVGEVMYRPTLLEVILNMLNAVVLVLVALWLVHAISKLLFGGQGSFHPFLRVMGYGYVVGVLHFVPFLTIFVGLWMVVLLFYALQRVKELTPVKAAFSLLIVILIFILIFMGWTAVNPANLYGGLYLLP